MLGGLVQSGAKALGESRFGLVNLVPAAYLVGFITLMVMSGAYSTGRPRLTGVARTVSEQPGWVAVVVFLVFLVAVLLRPFQAAVVQVLEGYWTRWPVLRSLAGAAAERHRRSQRSALISSLAQPLTDDNALDAGAVRAHQRAEYRAAQIRQRANRRLRHYPAPPRTPDDHDRLMPTTLGNVLRRGEDDAAQRYGLDFTVAYPRIYPSLSAPIGAAISRSLDLLDVSSALAISFALSAVAALPLATHFHLWAFVPFIAGAAAVLAYRGAVQTARDHARLLSTAIDLHRFDMLDALHLKLPANPVDESVLNRRLSAFLDGHLTAAEKLSDIPYEHPQPADFIVSRIRKPPASP